MKKETKHLVSIGEEEAKKIILARLRNDSVSGGHLPTNDEDIQINFFRGNHDDPPEVILSWVTVGEQKL